MRALEDPSRPPLRAGTSGRGRGLEPRLEHRARLPDRSKSVCRKTRFPPRPEGPEDGWPIGRLGTRHPSKDPEGDAGRRETSGCLFDTVPVSRRPAEGPRPYQETPPFRFCVTVAPPASTPDPRAWCSPACRPVRGGRLGQDRLRRSRPHRASYWARLRLFLGADPGAAWASSRLGVASRTAPGAMATGPPTREPPHLPTSLAGRSPEKLPRLVREVSAEVVGFFVYGVKPIPQ